MKIKAIIFALLVSVSGLKATAQQATDEAAYMKVITNRSAKIVTAIGITDNTSKKFFKVRDIIVKQYYNLNKTHEARAAKIKSIKETAGEDKASAVKKTAEVDSLTNIELGKLHAAYLSALNKQLDAEQVEGVKNHMTYNVFNITYAAYQDELPQLTDEQKAQIKNWLLEAREKAMDAESSNKKHEVFGKYKGRINNYLSKQGYDMKKAGEEWQKRIKERQAQKAAGQQNG